ncbi:MAG: CO dehydrogenase/CO-methylating acetyl-CoA synthase complex subunit beta [Firmicutes bacterium]|jgi:acetyl-CoA synthase|nr:CO dehydrogenase/CO-methylating acetyl-CoA synthase complex subunit beta [Bacillota bacterium]
MAESSGFEGVLAREWKESFEEIYEGSIDESNPPLKLFKKAYDGAVIATSYAEILLNQAIRRYGPDKPVGYPDTGYYLPVIRALSGEAVTKLGELPPILNRMRNQIYEELNFYNARLCGEATAYAAEIIEALRYLDGARLHVDPWTGFLGDPVVRRYGILLVDWTIPGQAVIMGRGKSKEAVAKLVQELQSKGFMIFLCNQVVEQAIEAGLKLGIDFIAFPTGNFTQIIHAVNYALRAGMAFGGIPPGERQNTRDYQRRRVRAFVLQLGEIDEVQVAAHFAAIFLGFPVITDQELPADEQIPNWYISHPNYDDMVKVALEIRGIKLKIVDIPVPITVGPAFEGEVIRKHDMRIEFGGGRTTAFELVEMVGEDEIEDGKIEVIGPELDDVPEGGSLPLGIVVKIFGRKMQKDFEGVLERRIHYLINYGEGIWHMAQRDTIWVRISKDAAAKGFKIRHFGDLLVAKFKDEFPAIVDRVQVTLITDKERIEAELARAREFYGARDERLRGLTDEAVDVFYSCILCQSFAPNHVCVVTPERLGLCGAVSWLDAKAAYEIDPTGPNRPIKKEGLIDAEKGIWQSINEYVYLNSNRTIEECSIYSFMDRPMTSCGCFECIMAIMPEANGVMIVTREYSGETPCGMTFSTLAGTVGGGIQTPGFMGHGRTYILSRKFISADGGLARVVWMPKELKEYLGDGLRQRAEEAGLGADFVDKIADETVGTTAEEVLPFLEEKGHPALTLDPLM